MNSWGSDWADGGFAKISYSDFIRYTEQAFYLDL
jgi:C1A family cysteine protease